MRRFLIFTLVVVLLTACRIPGAVTTTPTAESTQMPAVLPAILEAFPLSPGAVWTYAAQIDYQDPNDVEKTIQWTGYVSVRVTGQETSPEGEWVFTLEETLDPAPPPEVWRQPRTYQYRVIDGEVFDGNRKLLHWPLADNLSWKTWPDFDYQTEAAFQGGIESPYGSLDGCYAVTLLTGPDVTTDTFCPGVGFVQHFYRHFGTPQDEFFELVSFERGGE